MKKGKVFFHPIDGSGSLTISWSGGPKGDAVEAKRGSGVGFFSESGDLLCVIFDEVQSEKDHQMLTFPHHSVEIAVRKGKVTFNIIKNLAPLRKKRIKHKVTLRKKRSSFTATR